MPYEEIYFQRLKEEDPEEYQKIEINEQNPRPRQWLY
jgi:hypothetical protein